MATVRPPLRDVVAGQVLASLARITDDVEGASAGNIVLIVDDEALRVLNACLPADALVKAGFITVSVLETPSEVAEGKRRPKHEALEAVYFMRPTPYNLERICADFEVDVEPDSRDFIERCMPCLFRGIGTVAAEPAWYAGWRLLVLPSIARRDAGPFDYITARSWIDSQLQSRSRELERVPLCLKHDDAANVCMPQIMAYESNLFSLDLPDVLSKVYSGLVVRGSASTPRDDDEANETAAATKAVLDSLELVAYRLMTALLALNELPYVRHSDSDAASIVATALNKHFNIYQRAHPEWRPHGRGNPRGEDDISLGSRAAAAGEPPEPAVLVIVDRVDDIAPALLHDVTYSSLVVDLLHHVPSTSLLFDYKGKSSSGGEGASKRYEVLLDEHDPVWRNLRYDDMPTIIDATDELVRGMKAREARRQVSDGGEDIEELRRLMAVLASDEKALDAKIAQHYRMRRVIEGRFEKRRLYEVISLEQSLVTGVDSSGAKAGRADIDAAMRKLLADLAADKASLRRRIERGEKTDADNEKLKPLLREVECDQMRLLMLYVLASRAVEPKVLKELQALADLSADQRHTLANLDLLKVPLSRAAADARPPGAPFVDDETMRRNKKVAEKTQKLCRYVPKLEDIVTHQIAGTLPEDKYPWVKAPPRGRGAGGGTGYGVGDPVPTQHASAIAYHGSHGEVVNKYTAATIEERRSEGGGVSATSAAAAGKRGKESRFTMKASAAGGLKATTSFAGKPAGGGPDAEPPDLYAQHLEPPSLRAYAGGRVIVFVLGGLSQAEAAAVDRLSKASNREMIVGTTSLSTAQDFVDALFDADPPEGGRGGGDAAGRAGDDAAAVGLRAKSGKGKAAEPAPEPAAKGGKKAAPAPAKSKGGKSASGFDEPDLEGIDFD